MVTRYLVLLLLFLSVSASAQTTGSVTLAWDANIEENIAGYIIYYGTTSRYDSSVALTIPATIEKNCGTDVECKESWENYCTCVEWNEDSTCKTAPSPPDPACDSDYYKYDSSVDVKNVTEYELTGLTKGVKYYFAATAYNTEYPKRNNESKFSIELEHIVTIVSKIMNFRKIPEVDGK